MNLPDQLAAVEREIRMRRRVYPRWVSDGRMSQQKADHEIAAMEAVAETLRGLMPPEPEQRAFIDVPRHLRRGAD